MENFRELSTAEYGKILINFENVSHVISATGGNKGSYVYTTRGGDYDVIHVLESLDDLRVMTKT